jgi:cytochrome c oxidase subunit 4
MIRLLAAWIALIVLAAASWAVSYVHLGRWGLLIALVIALAKALVVLAVFMELARERATTRLVAVTAVLLVAVFIGFVAADPSTREGSPAQSHVVAP